MITDNPSTLPCDRNNCRCGNNENCMYYNNSENGHYNYTAVQMTGDRNSPYYKCPSAAYDTYNQEQVYEDGIISNTGAPGEFGAYNDMGSYGSINDPKGFYGPAPLSYPEKPTCSGFPSQGKMTATAANRDGDYDKADRLHRYRSLHLVDNRVPQEQPGFSLALATGSGLPKLLVGYNQNKVNLTPWLLLLAAGLTLMWARNSGKVSDQASVIVATILLVVFFLQKN